MTAPTQAMTLRAQLLNKDCLGGALVALLGAGAIAAARSYEVGTLARMGPGFFPTAIGAVMLLTGVSIFVAGLRRTVVDTDRVKAPDLRAWTLIPLSLLAFIVVGEQAGLLPATFSLVLVAAAADRRNGWRGALLLAVAMAMVALVVFWWGLQVQFPLFTLGPDE